MTSIITDKKYNIIYLDPPWKYGGTGGGEMETRR